MKTLVDQIHEYIHEDIISGRLLPGQRLHIAQLAEHHKVGPGPIREALSRLMATELVVAISQKGFRVADISRTDMRDIYESRAHIEALALELAIEHGQDDWEAAIVGSYHRLAKFESEHKIETSEDYKEWERCHRAFNSALLSACGLQHLLRTQQHLYNLTERYRRQWLIAGIKQPQGVPYAKRQKKIMEAALKRDAKLAKELIYKHFQEATKVIEAFFVEKKLF